MGRQLVLPAVLCLSALALSARADIEAYLILENDCVFQQDNDFTHGTEIQMVDVDAGLHYMVSQTMYAPDNLREKEHIKGDRPYCGMILGGVGYEFFRDWTSPWTHYGELDFGMIGPAAGCKWTQKTIHKWLGCKDPQGWDNQLHNEIVVNGQWWTKYNYYLADWVAIVPRIGAAAGNLQDMLEVGCDLKIGWNIRPTVNNEIIFSSSRHQSWLDKMSAYVFGGVGERYYLYNHILEGSMFNHKDKGLDVDIEPFVTEFRTGAVFKYDRFFSSFYLVFRTDEFKHQKNDPNYGGMTVGWTF